MTTFQFNGLHLAICLGMFALGYALGALYGWLLRDERNPASGGSCVADGRKSRNTPKEGDE